MRHFLGSGLKLKLSVLRQAAADVKLHAFVQSFHFLLSPLLFGIVYTIAVQILPVNPILLQGLLVLGCLPPPISSAVILTSVSGGNVAISIINSSLGSFLGIFFTPPLLMVCTGRHADVSVHKLFLKLGSTVLMPLLVGIMLKRYGIARPLPSSLGSGILILIIWHAFCEMFRSDNLNVSAMEIMMLAGVILFVQAMMVTFAYNGLRRMDAQLPRENVVAACYTSYHKSLTLGMPILMSMYSGWSSFALLCLPLLLYHPLQILGGSFLVSYARRWIEDDSDNDSSVDGGMAKAYPSRSLEMTSARGPSMV